MRAHLIAFALFLMGGAAQAQIPTPSCPHPPCAPGTGFTDPNTGQARVICRNWNHLDCMVISVQDKLIAAKDLLPGMNGRLEVYDENGGSHKYAFTNYKKTTTGAEGTIVEFGSLKED